MVKQHLAEIIASCQSRNQRLSAYFLEQEVELGEGDEAGILERMERNLVVMERAAGQGLKGVDSYSGLSGGDAKRLLEYRIKGSPLGNSLYLEAVMTAVAVNEVNASKGIITTTVLASNLSPAWFMCPASSVLLWVLLTP